MASKPSPSPVKHRRTQLGLTQQEAAQRANVSLATWRRFENLAGDDDALRGFRTDNVRGFARALRLTDTSLRRLAAGEALHDSMAGNADPLDFDAGTLEIVRDFNKSFTGDPLTPADAMVLGQTVDFSDFAPTRDGQLHTDAMLGCGFAEYLKGAATIRDVQLLSDLPNFVLTQVSNNWLMRMGERIMRIGSELDSGRVPRPECLADEYALWIVISNTEPPQLSDVYDMFPGIRGPEDVFGYDPDFDDPEDEQGGREDWRNRMVGGLLPPDESHDFRRYDLTLMEVYEQGVYDPTDSRHPLRWFDRDALRERCESEIAFVRLTKEEQEKITAEKLKNFDQLFSAASPDGPDQGRVTSRQHLLPSDRHSARGVSPGSNASRKPAK